MCATFRSSALSSTRAPTASTSTETDLRSVGSENRGKARTLPYSAHGSVPHFVRAQKPVSRNFDRARFQKISVEYCVCGQSRKGEKYDEKRIKKPPAALRLLCRGLIVENIPFGKVGLLHNSKCKYPACAKASAGRQKSK